MEKYGALGEEIVAAFSHEMLDPVEFTDWIASSISS